MNFNISKKLRKIKLIQYFKISLESYLFLFFSLIFIFSLAYVYFLLPQAEAIPFLAAQPYNTPGTITDFIKEDINNDNVDDIIAANNYIDGYVSVFIGNSNGTFQSAVDYTVGLGVKAVLTSDFNHDNSLDLATINSTDNTISILLNNGNGTFAGAVNYDAGADSPLTMIIDDFNNDDQQDFVLGFDSTNDIAVLLNDGSGGYEPAQFYRVFLPYYGKIKSIDLNGDGYLDIITNQTYLINNQDGTFAANIFRLDDGDANEVYDFEIADFNNDNNADVVFSVLDIFDINNPPSYSSPGAAFVVLGNGDGTFSGEQKYITGLNAVSIKTADFNNDNKLDFAVGSRNIFGDLTDNNIQIYLGNGDGTFMQSQDLAITDPPIRFAVTDLNNDNFADLIYLEPLKVLLGNGDGTFEENGSYNVNSVKHLYTVDLNNDNNQDLITANNSSLQLIFGQGNGLLGALGSYSISAGPENLISADFNNDDIEDIVTVNKSSNNISLSLGNGNGTFASPQYFSVGSQPMAVTAGDFNKDTNIDLAVANSGDNSVSVLLGDGNANFNALADFSVGDGPFDIVNFDFDKNNVLDLAVVNNTAGTVGIYLGQGDGTFNYLNDLSVNSSPRSIAGADFNGDGFLDLAVTNSGSNNVSILLGAGAGNFDAAIDFAVGTTPYSLVADDFNDDDLIDLAVVNFGTLTSSTISVLMGVGNGDFETPTEYLIHSNVLHPESYDIVSADISGDGIPDLAVTNSDSYDVSPFINEGNGVFSESTRLRPGGNPHGIIADDFNGDGNNDYAIAVYGDDNLVIAIDFGFVLSNLETTAVFAGTPGFSLKLYGSGFGQNDIGQFNGSNRSTSFIDDNTLAMNLLSSDLTSFGLFDVNVFDPGYNVTTASLPINIQGVFVDKVDTSLGFSPDYIASADFNKDGKNDLAILNSADDQINIFNGNGSSGFTSVSSYSTGDNPSALTIADINGDNASDLVVVNSDSNDLSIYLGNNASNFTEITESPLAVGNNPKAVVVFDVDSDNRQDIIVANNSDNNIQIFLQQSDGSFLESPNSPIGVGDQPVALKKQDVNNDSKTDLIIVNQGSSNISVLLNNGFGNFLPAANSPFNVGSQPVDLCIKDFDSDNKLDLAVVNKGNNNVSIFKGNSTGVFSAGSSFNVGQSPVSINCNDYNHDRYNDLAVLNNLDNNVSLLLGDGTGQFGLAVNYATAGGPVGMVSGLFNKDGNLDLITVNSTDDNFSVLLGRSLLAAGSSLFSSSKSYSLESQPTNFVLDDFNNDNKPDLAVTNFSSGNVSVLRGIGGGTFAAKVNYTISDNVNTVSSGDFNNDGYIDLIMGANNNSRINGVPDVYSSFNNGDGTFASPINFTPYVGGAFVTAGDFNNDNLTDFAVAINSLRLGKVVVYLSNGDGSFNSLDLYPSRDFLAVRVFSFETADLNHDNNLDLLIGSDALGGNVILWGDGSGNFTEYELPTSPQGEMTSADFNGDDFSDLIINNAGVLINNGDNTFSDPVAIDNFFTAEGPVATGDFNNDGIIDLATTGKDSRTKVGIAKIIMGLGNGRFDLASQYLVGGANPTKIKALDLNSDNRDDLIVLDSSSNIISVLLSTIPRSGLTFYPEAPKNFTCVALTANSIRWSFEDTATNETGFRLYGPEGEILDTGEKITTDLNHLDETNLEPNILYPDRYVRSFNGAGESTDSNKAGCYTLANQPLPLVIGSATENGLEVFLDNNDGNPDYTEYAIYEYYSNKYVQEDGSLSSEPVWQTYENWGGESGLQIISESLDLSKYEFYVLAKNGDGIVSGFKPGEVDLSCETLSSHEILWHFRTINDLIKQGFRLYEKSEEEDSLVFEMQAPDLTEAEYTEPDLQPNTSYTRYLQVFNSDGEESGSKNEVSCVTLANEPLPVIIGEITDDSVQVILDNNDGNPAYTKYAIFEAKSGQYVQVDGSLGPEPVWQTYEEWGSSSGIYVQIANAGAGDINLNVNAQFSISLTGDDFLFIAQVQNTQGVVTTIPEKKSAIFANKEVAINFSFEPITYFNFVKTALAAGTFTAQSHLLALGQEFSFFLIIISLILFILLLIGLHGALKNLFPKARRRGSLNLIFNLLFKEPALVFSDKAERNNGGVYKISYEKYRYFHNFSQKNFKRFLGVLFLNLLLLTFITIKLNHNSLAQAGFINQDGQVVFAGDNLTYKISFNNSSDNEAENIVLVDPLDENLTYVDGSASLYVDNQKNNANVSIVDNNLSFAIGNLAPASFGYVLFNAQIKDSSIGEVINNQAQISGDNFETVLTNITANKIEESGVIPEKETEPLKTLEENQESNEQLAPIATVSGGQTINAAPLAVNDTVETAQNTSISIFVLANDSDFDGVLDLQTLAIVSQPNNGRVIVDNFNGAITYTPNEDFIGEDNFSYVICDSENACAQANVSVNVFSEKEVTAAIVSNSFLKTITTDITKTQTAQKIIGNVKENKTVKSIIESQPVKVISEKVLDNPAVEQASQDVVTPALVTVTIVNTVPTAVSFSFNIWAYLNFLFIEPFLLLFKKKRKQWGVVYNSLTKIPIALAVVRLYSKADNKLVQTKVTDKNGRYLFIVKDPGIYYLEVIKPDYEFPTKYLREEKSDTKYLDLYHGEQIEVNDKDGAITANIPLDPREKSALPLPKVIKNYLIKNLRLAVSYAGLILAVLVIIIYPSIITLTSIFIHILLFISFRKLIVPPAPKKWGIVYDEKSKKMLDYAVVRIFDTKFNKLLETQVTDRKGRYAFLVGPNVYQLLVEKDGYQPAEIKPVDLTQKEEIVNLDVGLLKKQ